MIFRELMRFAVVGIANTLVEFGVFIALLYFANWSLLFANSAAYVVAVVNSYLLNKHWTFSHGNTSRNSVRQFLLFVAISLVGLAFSNATVWLYALALHPIIAKGLSILTVFVWNFWSSRKYVFKPLS